MNKVQIIAEIFRLIFFQFEHLHIEDKIDDLVRVSEEASKQRVYVREKLEVTFK